MQTKQDEHSVHRMISPSLPDSILPAVSGSAIICRPTAIMSADPSARAFSATSLYASFPTAITGTVTADLIRAA
jgi:hypothetical protein